MQQDDKCWQMVAKGRNRVGIVLDPTDETDGAQQRRWMNWVRR